MSVLRLLLITALAPASCVLGAQDGSMSQEQEMMLFGIVEDERGNAPMQNVCVRVYTDSIAGDSVFTDPMGKYQVFVPLKGVHTLVYRMDGYHRKTVQVDTNGEMDNVARTKEWNIRIDIGLAQAGKPLPDDLLDTPIGRAKWQPSLGEFQWDQPYTERYKQRYKQALKAAER